jgi:hypothetical protein
MKQLLASSLLIAVLFSSCKKDDVTCNGSTPTYNSTVKQILDSKCMSCHGSGSSDGDYSTYSKLSPILTSGKFEEEVLTKKSMPQGSSLSSDQLSTLRCWIDNGFPQ